VTPIVVAHDLGDTGNGWRDALRDWPDEVAAPDLAVQGASGDRTDVVWLLLEQLESWRARAPVLVGCGEHALAAETFALAGWVGRLVLVDGLGGAWMTADEQIDAQNAWLRAKLANPDAPGYPAVWVEPFVTSLRANVHCPVLVVETNRSVTPPPEVDRRARQFAGPSKVVQIDTPDPATVISAVREWMGS
jgi:pimeloyl-ACP methyl ester carboxylesterase